MKRSGTERGRRILAAVAALCVAVGMISWPVGKKEVRAEALTSGDFEYEALTDTTAVITGYTGIEPNVEIPEKVGDRTVTQIGDQAFKGNRIITEVNIPSGVTIIGKEAFSDCLYLTNIVVPRSVERIEEFAFEDTRLTKITIPDSITKIEESVFDGCKELREIDIPNSVTDIGVAAFRWTGLTKITIPDSVTRIEAQAFYSCTKLKEIDLPSSVNDIGFLAFSDTGLTKITIPDSVTQIGGCVFQDCADLREIDLPSSITDIGMSAFAGAGLTKITIPDSVTQIGAYAFQDCADLREIDLPSNITNIESYVFAGAGLTKITIPNSVTQIKLGSFLNCANLKEINLPGSITYIGESAFRGTGLVEINIPDSVTQIGDRVFQDCADLQDVYYSGTEEEWNAIQIGEQNESLLNATIHFNETPDDTLNDYKYRKLEDGTIEITEYNGSDTIVEIPREIEGCLVTSIGYNAFSGNDTVEEITIPSSVTNLESSENGGQLYFGYCPNLRVIHVEEDNPEFSSEDGVLFNKDMTELIRCPEGRSGAYIVPDGVVRLAGQAFMQCKKLTEVTVKNEVSRIGFATFYACEGMTKLTLSERLTSLAPTAFANCPMLKEIKMPGIKEMHRGYFSTCPSLEKIELSEGTIYIHEDAFRFISKLQAVTIPESVTEIGGSIFSESNNTLSDVYYGGTKEQWEQIRVPDTDDSLTVREKIGIPSTAVIHFKDDLAPEEPVLPEVIDTKQDLEQIKADKPFSLDEDFSQYMSPDQIDTLKGYLYTWLAEINYAYQYPDTGSSRAVREQIMKKAGIDPDGSFASGTEQAITHISVETKYGPKIFEITMELGRADSSGNLYPAYGALHYEVLEKGDIPPEVPTSGEIGKASGTELESYIRSVSRTLKETLRSTYQWESMRDRQTAGVLTDRTVTEIIGNKNGSFSGGVFNIYETPLDSYRKKVTVSGSANVQVYIYDMRGNTAATIINNKPSVAKSHQEGEAGIGIRIRVNADTNEKVIFLSGNDYYIKLCGAGTRTAKVRTVEANAESGDCIQSSAASGQMKTAKGVTGSRGMIQSSAASGQKQTVKAVTGSKGMIQSSTASARISAARSGGLTYTVEEVANDEVCRTVQFLENQLLEDMQYEGYVFRPLNIDRDLYALRVQGGTGQDMVYADADSYRSAFRMVEGLAISQDKTSMNLKNTIQLNASIHPMDASNPNLQWRSDNESVVTVDQNGMVSAVGTGRATITVLTKDGSFLKQFCIFDISGSSDNTGGNGSGSTSGSGADNSGSSGDNSSGTGSRPGGSSTGSSGGSGTGVSGGTGGSGASGQGSVPVVSGLHYVIQFDVSGGTKLSRKTMTLLADDSPGIMPKAQRRDYTFSGWYTQKDGGVKVTGDQPLGEAVTLYAHWTKTAAPAETPSVELTLRKKGRVKVSFQKVKGAAGYQIDYSDSKKFADAQTKEAKASARAKTITGLAAGKKYYVRMRAYSVDSAGNRVYGEYGAVKRVKVKA